MLIKCKNCSKTYDVPDNEWLNLKPHFFKCFACGTVFQAPSEHENPANEKKSNMTPLVEIFTEQPEEEQSVNISKNEIPEQGSLKNESNTHIFEPVKEKKTFAWSKIIISASACITTVICVLFVISVMRLYLVDKCTVVSSDKNDTFNQRDFTFNQTQFTLTGENNLFVAGQLVNSTNRKKKTPAVLVLLKNKKDKELQRQYAKIKRATLDSKEALHFNVGVENIPPDTFKVEIVARENK